MIDSRSPATIQRGVGEGAEEQVLVIITGIRNKESSTSLCNHMTKKILFQYVPGPGDKETNPGVSFTTLNFKYFV